MKRFYTLAGISALAIAPAFADTALYQGTFADDDDVAQITLNVAAPELVTIQSWGYAGGVVPTSPNPTTVAEGGFAPVVYLFDGTGTEIASNNGSGCITGNDSVTGNCDDPYLQESLTAGTYTLAVAVWDNTPNDNLLADGFVNDGNPGFTCAEFGLTGEFCDVTTALGTPRTGDYAVSVTTTPEVTTPEPSAFSLLFAAGAFFATLYYRRRFV